MTARQVTALVGALLTSGVMLAGPASAEPGAAMLHASKGFGPAGVVPHRVAPQQAALSAYRRMTHAERLGQLFMVGVPSTGIGSSEDSVLVARSVGDVILAHNSAQSRHTIHRNSRHLVASLRTAGVEPFLSTDQEGGLVQRLTGTGFSRIPSALSQGQLSPSSLKAFSTTWGSQLARAGVDVDLAPVADTVPARHAHANQPIGQFDREYGHRPDVVARHVVAFVRGMNAAGVAPTLKHFPGLGRASGNTDDSPHVTDPTTRNDGYLKPFRDGVNAGAAFVMVSSATYPRIDAAQPACFSSVVMTSMLRGDLHFQGVVISDDLGTSALGGTSVPQRAVKFFAAGGTMVLDTTYRQIPAMIRAVSVKTKHNPGFAATVKEAVVTDLVTKARAGLIAR